MRASHSLISPEQCDNLGKGYEARLVDIPKACYPHAS